MKKSILISSVLIAVGFSFAAVASCQETDPLFRVERSKNKNIVQYDICLSNNGDISDSDPVKAYWVLENGKKEELNAIQRKYAYGIKSQEKLGENKFRIVLVALKDRTIMIEKIADDFKAIFLIAGNQSILEKIYVKAEERKIGLPKVQYIDLFGRTVQTDVSVKERIIPQ